MTFIISSYTPNSYILYLFLLSPEKFNILFKNICKDYQLLKYTEIIQILKILYYNTTWTIESSPKLNELSKIPFSSLPIWLVKNSTNTKYRMETTFNGIPLNLAKSGIQKYIRRAQTTKAIYLTTDSYLTHWTEGSQGMLTNVYNRLRITFLEDISIAAPSMLKLVHNILEKSPQQILSAELPYLIHCMSNSLHTRCYSHIKSHYRISPPEITQKNPNNHINLEKDEDLRKFVDPFVWCLENKNIEALWWLYKILEKEKLNTKRFNSTRPGFLIFKILIKLKFQIDDYTVPICQEWYKTMKMKEQILCLTHPVMLYILQENAIFIPTNTQAWNKSYYESRTPYNKSLLNDTIILDNFVYDKHTKAGRDIFKRNYADFALEGSLVAFDLEVFPKFAKEYMEEYIQKGTIFRENQEFQFKIRTQINTSAHKPDVYFATNKLKQNIVVKGPYTNLTLALIPFKLSNIAKLFQHVNVPNINIRILYPNMWEKVPLGIRNTTTPETHQYFVIMNDLMNLSKYPEMSKSSKMWKNETVVDWDKVFLNNTNFGIGIPSSMNDDSKFSLLIQLSFRLAFQIGDNSYRNFIRINNQVYNIDLEGFMGGTKIQWSAKEIIILNNILIKYNQQYKDILQSWLEPGDTYINKWDICRLSFSGKDTEKIKTNIQTLIDIKNFDNFDILTKIEQVKIHGIQFDKLGKFGDFDWMINQSKYSNALFIYNDDSESQLNKSYKKGKGNAIIRQYNQYADIKIPSSAGIPTGSRKNGGYTELNEEVKEKIDLSINNIKELIIKYDYKVIYYSAKLNGKLGTGIFKVNDEVINYITEQIINLNCWKL